MIKVIVSAVFAWFQFMHESSTIRTTAATTAIRTRTTSMSWSIHFVRVSVSVVMNGDAICLNFFAALGR